MTGEIHSTKIFDAMCEFLSQFRYKFSNGSRNMPHYLPNNLKDFGSKIHSQTDEDGIIEKIFQHIPPRSRYFVEFGIGPNWLDHDYVNGLEGNCVRLRDDLGWQGLMMDGGNHPAKYDVKREFIKPTNINGLLRKHGVPQDVDVISIDIDGQDFWVFMAMDYRPTLFIVEYNPNFFQMHQRLTVPFDEKFRWDGTKFYGASLGGLTYLARDKGYRLVYANGVNAFFVREDMLANPEDFNDDQLNSAHDQHMHDHLARRWEVLD